MEYIDDDVEVPLEFCCPITQKIMKNPYLMEDGFNYEKENIDEVLNENDCESPITGKKISKNGTQNVNLLQRIRQFIEDIKNKTINVFVSKLEGGHLTFHMKKNDTVMQLKQNIQDKIGMKVEYQRLIYQGKMLSCDSSTLNNYSIKNDSTVNLTARLVG